MSWKELNQRVVYKRGTYLLESMPLLRCLSSYDTQGDRFAPGTDASLCFIISAMLGIRLRRCFSLYLIDSGNNSRRG